MAKTEQVLDHLVGGGGVIDVDRRQAGVLPGARHREHAPLDRHREHLLQLAPLAGANPLTAHKDQRIHAVIRERLHVAPLHRRVAVGVANNHEIARAARRVFNPAGDFGEVRVDHVADENADDA